MATLKNAAIAILVPLPSIIFYLSFLSNSLPSALHQWCFDHSFLLANLLFFLNVNLLFWLIGLLLSTHWMIDPYWTIIPLMLTHYYSTHPSLLAAKSNGGGSLRSTVSILLTWVWSFRLTHSYFRREKWEWGAREDWRFGEMRVKYGKHWWWISFFAVYLSQQVFLIGICLPMYAIHSSSKPWDTWDSIATITCITGIIIAYFADTQLYNFVQSNEILKEKGAPLVLNLDKGLWRYSRHPNYFGEQLWWWGLFIFAWNVGQGWMFVSTHHPHHHHLQPFKSPESPPLSFNSPKSIPSSPICCTTSTLSTNTSAVVKNKRNRYRKAYPGEAKGIVEEMRFVAMKLRNNNNNKKSDDDEESESGAAGRGEKKETWLPRMEGFVRYLVDSKLVFETIEKIIDDSADVSYTYFRKTGLERTASLSKDLAWFRQQGIEIPEPSNPGVAYATYLAELAEKSAPSFLCHVYNIYFAHISGGQAIGKQVSEKLLQGKELELYNWDGDVPEMLSDVREKLNKLGEHWSRDEKNRCLRESAKSFRYSGQIIRLIIL